MTAPRFRTSVILLAGGAAIVLLSLFVATYFARSTAPPPPQSQVKQSPPALYCVFYDFTHATVVVGFDFAVTLAKGEPPRFDERAEAARDGTRKTFEDNQRPNWTYVIDEDGAPMITSPDGATRIVLYGLKPEAQGELWVGAGLRSNEYRNLDGQCRQNNLGGSDQSGSPTSPK